MSPKVFGNIFFLFHFVELAVLVMVSRWTKLVEEKDDYIDYVTTATNIQTTRYYT